MKIGYLNKPLTHMNIEELKFEREYMELNDSGDKVLERIASITKLLEKYGVE